MDGDQIFAEEFASGATGRIDVWSFYRRGVLTSEERDFNGDGKVDFQTRWDPRNGLLASVLGDTTMRGVNDLEVERTANNRWEIRQDRNLDGVTDRILFVAAPNDMFDSLDTDFATQSDIASLVPPENRREMWSDDAYTGSITDYYRYNSSGVLGQYGQWDGREIDWRRVPPDFVPQTAFAAAPAAPAQTFAPPPAAPAPVAQPQPFPAGYPPETIRDPFDLAAGAGDMDPYAGLTAAPATPDNAAQTGWDEGTARAAPPPSAPRVAQLPADESSARSVPARMRPPGSSARRRPGIF
jgi:hypothetical protein